MGTVYAGPRQRRPHSSTPERVDYLTFAQGAIPARIDGAGPQHGVN
jgi:hypothetical protein